MASIVAARENVEENTRAILRAAKKGENDKDPLAILRIPSKLLVDRQSSEEAARQIQEDMEAMSELMKGST